MLSGVIIDLTHEHGDSMAFYFSLRLGNRSEPKACQSIKTTLPKGPKITRMKVVNEIIKVVERLCSFTVYHKVQKEQMLLIWLLVHPFVARYLASEAASCG